jgi:hypothetical protein
MKFVAPCPLFNVVSRIKILKVSFTNIELGVGGGEIFWGLIL